VANDGTHPMMNVKTMDQIINFIFVVVIFPLVSSGRIQMDALDYFHHKHIVSNWLQKTDKLPS